MNLFKSLKLLLLSLFCLLNFHSLPSSARPLGEMPIQDGGRIKPYDTFAREHLKLIYGKFTYEGRPATEIVWTWLLQPDLWQDKPIFEIRYHLLKRALKLTETVNLFSLKEIFASDRLSVVMQELNAQREAKATLDPYFQSVQRLETQIAYFRELSSGRMFRFVPPVQGDAWISLPDLEADLQTQIQNVTKAFVGKIEAVASKGDIKEKESQLQQAVEDFCVKAQAANPELYKVQDKMHLEVLYNQIHPFQVSALIYLLSALAFVLLWIFKNNFFYKAAWILAILGAITNVLGFAVRIYLMERAPVTNMYETVIWVAFGAVIFAMIMEAMYRWKFILAAGVSVAAFCCLLGDLAPAVLDSSLQPLEPVLRSNYWLTVHVMTITISYAAFFLAFALGDFGLVLYFLGEKKHEEKIRGLTLAIYRSIQIGVALLGPGIILGGIWANDSWGRFWGWDPKETWALIALLGYLAILHARLAGFLRGFGIVASAVVAFSLVIMAWYGVNFVLGAGLHTYGFGAGGVEYVAAFVGVHLVFVAYMVVARRSQNKVL